MCPLGIVCFSASLTSALAMLAVMVLVSIKRLGAARWVAWVSAALLASASFAFIMGGLQRQWQPGWVVIAVANAVAGQMMLAGFL
jgi:hypothetical protein